MPKRTDIKSILIIGAGPIVIGQACEFDYSGTQAVKTLRAEGYRVILVNSNPATIMTDPELADATYIEPILPEFVEKIIAKERPDALLPTMGGQTALNCAKALAESGVLKKYNVEMIGAKLDSINKAEDRLLFGQAMAKIGLEVPKNLVVKSLEEAREARKTIGLPAIIRPSFTMGGSGGGIAYNNEEFDAIVTSGLDASPVGEVMIDESVLGWKEYEMEVVRDKADNCIIICSIENIDPMGVHTGDSITVAPALTLTDKEYQIMRDASIAVLREIGVDTGGSNVQFAVNPENGRMVVIEMNPRVSRSSALASKATGFPIAKVAAKLAVGYTLDEILNDVVAGESRVVSRELRGADVTSHDSSHKTRATIRMPASFEPTIDYVVTKIPRFAFEKFPGTNNTLTTAMKSVGESMAMGRNFAESLQKALRSLETGITGLNEIEIPGMTGPDDMDALRAALGTPTPERLLYAAQALRMGMSAEDVQHYTKYDPWFIAQFQMIVDAEKDIRQLRDSDIRFNGYPDHQDKFDLYLQNLTSRDAEKFFTWKRMGFSDARIAELASIGTATITLVRKKLEIHPVYKRVDTCAAEFASNTPYMYSTYEGAWVRGQGSEKNTPDLWTLIPGCEAAPSSAKKIIILGGGPNRIGQGIEFDYCCVHACYALRDAGFETIMVNCNPETVSTDYDTADRLYFEPLTAEDVIAICRKEQENGELVGVIVQFGGQTPLKLAHALQAEGIPIIGTSPDSIDLAEDRERFQQLLHKLALKQPKNSICHSVEDVMRDAETIGFPVVVRPSYVLGGRAMAIIHDAESLKSYTAELVKSFGDGPILLDSYLQDAIEVDVDALADKDGEVYVAAVMEHVEEAGIHSGDSACSLPANTLSAEIQNRIREQTVALARALNVVGLMNVQFAVKKIESRVASRESSGVDATSHDSNHETRATHDIYILEVNPRASRTTPFVAKATGVPIAKIAARLMAGEKLADITASAEARASHEPAKLRPMEFAGANSGGKTIGHVAVKEVVFPFARFPGVDVILGPEMKSTGETMGLDADFPRAFAKAWLGAGNTLPLQGAAFISVKESDKPLILNAARDLVATGFTLLATSGTARYLEAQGVPVHTVNKVREGRPHIVDMMKDGRVQLVINTTEGKQSIADSFSIRRTALQQKIAYSTTLSGSVAMVAAIHALKSGGLTVKPLQEYFA